MHVPTPSMLVFLCLLVYAHAASYYVSTSGSDGNGGTLSAPFRNVQKCASVAVAGDTCFIRAGTYRETVTPARSGTSSAPITFTSYNGEAVVVSGLDVVSSRTSSGCIWRTNLMNWDVTDRSSNYKIADNQIFVDGVHMPTARFPNIPINKATAQSFQDMATFDGVSVKNTANAVITDAAISGSTNFWRGAYINFAAGYMWQSGTCSVANSTSGSFWLQCLNDGGVTTNAWTTVWQQPPKATNRYYLWGILNALDAAGEWYFDRSSKTLYAWFPDGGAPANHIVEAKRRINCFDLSSKSYITLRGFSTIGGLVRTDFAGHVVINQMDIGFQYHQMYIPPQGEFGTTPSMWFNGVGHQVTDSYIHDCAGEVFYLEGNSHKITNNVFARTNYAPQGQASIFGSSTPSTLFSMNTLFQSGDIQIYGLNGMQISYNDAYNSGLQRVDFGTIYTYGSAANGGSIHHNWVHDCSSALDNVQGYSGCTGIYTDDGSSGWNVYRNVIWSVTGCGLNVRGQGADGVTADSIPPSPFLLTSLHPFSSLPLFLSPFSADIFSPHSNWKNFLLPSDVTFAYNSVAPLAPNAGTGICMATDETMRNVLVANNVFPSMGAFNPSATNLNNFNFDLVSGSSAKGSATGIGAPFDPSVSPFDHGAYQSGTPDWNLPGAYIRGVDLPALSLSCSTPSGGRFSCYILSSFTSLPIGNMPTGRKLPPTFGIGLGSNPSPFGSCSTVYSYTTHFGTDIRLDSGNSWTATTTKVTISATVATATTAATTAATATTATTAATVTTAAATTAKSTTTTTTGSSTTGASSGQPSGWVKVPGGSFKQVSVGAPKSVIALTTSGVVYLWSNPGWYNLGGPSFAQVDMGCDGVIYGVTSSGTVYMFNGQTFDLVPGSLKMVAVANGNVVYGIDYTTKRLVQRDWANNGNTWKVLDTSTLINVDAGCDNSVWVVTSANVGKKWSGTEIPGGLGQIGAGDNTHAWALNPYGDVVRWSSTTWVSLGAGKLSTISCSSGGTDVWGTTTDLNVWHYGSL